MTTLWRALAAGLLYLAAARYAMATRELVDAGAVFWPAAGVTVTVLLASPRRSWPVVLLAVGLAESINNLWLGFTAQPTLWWAAANVVEGFLAAWLIERWRADRFEDVRGVLWFALAALLAPVVGGLVAALGTAGLPAALPYVVTAGEWVIGDALGILTVVPAGLLALGRSPGPQRWTIEGAVALAVVAALTLAVFGWGDEQRFLSGRYLVLVPMVWVAVRFPVPGAALAVFLVTQLATALSALGRGPFVGPHVDLAARSAHLQLFLAIVAITVLLLATQAVESSRFHDLAEARARLIAAVSHELRTPLTPIVGFSELLLRQRADLDAPTRQGLQVILRNGRHLTNLVDDLLAVSRARRGSLLPVQPEHIQLAAFLDEILLDRRDVTIERGVIPEGATVWADRTHLTQIVTQLLDNARRHGQPPIDLGAAVSESTTTLAVSDRGPGVPDWFVPDLFEEFAQVTDGDNRASSGLGLGLPIARSLARANGGELAYEPNGTPGARFVVTLPRRPPERP